MHRRLTRISVMVVGAVGLWGSLLSAQQVGGGPQFIPLLRLGTSPPLRDLPGVPAPPGPPRVIPLRRVPPAGPATQQPDPVVQTTAGPLVATSSGLSIEGVGAGANGYTVAPPDTNGAVGSTQYVQWVNLSLAVFDKATGALLPNFPKPGNSIWWGSGLTACEQTNDGDPIILHDQAADRWFAAQLSYSLATPYYLCLAVSTTPDATGSWNRYALEWSNHLPDYPKIGVWGDAYYVTANLFLWGAIFSGAQTCALDRALLLSNGVPQTGSAQCFTLTKYDSLLPADVDGPPAPAGRPNFLLNMGSNALNLWRFHVDFVNTGNTTLSGPISIPVAAFSVPCSGGGACIPQSEPTQKLDSLADRLMYRLAYRNFRDHESLVVNHSVSAGSAVGVRWYEIRNPNGTPSVFQQGTYAPDGNYRWMGSMAMDHAGNMALGYSVSSGSMSPAIRYTGRVPADPVGTLQAETEIIAGTGSQTGGLERWGDYSSMSVDPVDDCTFWYTTEYLAISGSFNWNTRIASFKFPSCSTTPDFSISATPASQSVTQGGTTSYTVSVSATGGFSGTVDLSLGGLPSGATGNFVPASIPGSGTSTLTVNTGTAAAGTYALTITGTSSSLIHSTNVTLVINAPATPDFSLSASPGSRNIKAGTNTTYTVTVTPSGGFAGSVTLSISGLPANSSGSFSPNPVSGGSGSSTLTVTTASNTPKGSSTITITGTSGSLSHNTTVSLRVR